MAEGNMQEPRTHPNPSTDFFFHVHPSIHLAMHPPIQTSNYAPPFIYPLLHSSTTCWSIYLPTHPLRSAPATVSQELGISSIQSTCSHKAHFPLALVFPLK